MNSTNFLLADFNVHTQIWRSLGLKSRVQKRKEQNTTENRAARAYPWPASSVGSRVNSKHSTHPTCRRTAHQALAWGGQSWGGANSNKNHRETAIFNLPSFSAFARAVFFGEIRRGCLPSFKFLEHTDSPHHQRSVWVVPELNPRWEHQIPIIFLSLPLFKKGQFRHKQAGHRNWPPRDEIPPARSGFELPASPRSSSYNGLWVVAPASEHALRS